MSNPKVWGAGGLPFNGVPGSANLTTLDLYVSQSINGVAGGVEAPIAPIIIAGAGLQTGISTVNGNGLISTGDGTGAGVVATGGAASGGGGSFVGGAPNGVGVSAQGTGSGFGLGAVGGATGFGLLGQAGGGNQPGVKAQGAGTGPDIECLTGPILFSGAQPASNVDPGTNRLHSTNFVKAWAIITTDGLGGAVVTDGFNVASATAVSAVLTLNLAGAMASAVYGVKAHDMKVPAAGNARTYNSDSTTNTASAVKVGGRTITAGSVASVDFAAEALVVFVEVMGRQ